MHDFFDLFIIGEAEEAVVELIDAYRKVKDKFKSGMLDKPGFAFGAFRIEGVYVPSFYEANMVQTEELQNFSQRSRALNLRVKKRIIHDLDNAYSPDALVGAFITSSA